MSRHRRRSRNRNASNSSIITTTKINNNDNNRTLNTQEKMPEGATTNGAMISVTRTNGDLCAGATPVASSSSSGPYLPSTSTSILSSLKKLVWQTPVVDDDVSRKRRRAEEEDANTLIASTPVPGKGKPKRRRLEKPEEITEVEGEKQEREREIGRQTKGEFPAPYIISM
nr:uncharacterized protein LOC129255546 [Lytechinus pictus]